MVIISYASLRDKGKEREYQQDNLFSGCNRIEKPSALDEEIRDALFVVADGMGGHVGGAKASQLIVDGAKLLYTQEGVESNSNNLTSGLPELLANYSNTVVYAYNKAKGLESGSTIVTLYLNNNGTGVVQHLGDSRLYQLTREEFRRVTKDHSLVQMLVDQGRIPKENSWKHPLSNIIASAAGFKKEAPIEENIQEITYGPGDMFLLCSDGLTGEVREEEIKKILEGYATGDLNECAQELIDTANNNGGSDNITAIVVRIEYDFDCIVDTTYPPRRPSGVEIPDWDFGEEKPNQDERLEMYIKVAEENDRLVEEHEKNRK